MPKSCAVTGGDSRMRRPVRPDRRRHACAASHAPGCRDHVRRAVPRQIVEPPRTGRNIASSASRSAGTPSTQAARSHSAPSKIVFAIDQPRSTRLHDHHRHIAGQRNVLPNPVCDNRSTGHGPPRVRRWRSESRLPQAHTGNGRIRRAVPARQSRSGPVQPAARAAQWVSATSNWPRRQAGAAHNAAGNRQSAAPHRNPARFNSSTART